MNDSNIMSTSPPIDDPNPPASSDSSNLIEAPAEISRSKRILIQCGWIGFAIFSLIFFTIAKLPDDRVKGYIDGNISNFLAPRGISYTSQESSLSILFGLAYTLKGVTLNLPPPYPAGHLDQIKVSPSLLSLLLGRVAVNFELYDKASEGGSLTGSASFSKNGTSFSTTYKAKKFDLGKTGILPALTSLQILCVLDGNGSVSGNLSDPHSLEGNLSLQLGKVSLEPQSISGFSIPKVNISDGVAEVVFDKGKATVKSFRLGKPGNPADDIQGTLAGDLALGKQWESSTLNMKARFSISENLMKSFVLLDAILGGGKQPDGSYAFSLTGPLMAPVPAPLSSLEK